MLVNNIEIRIVYRNNFGSKLRFTDYLRIDSLYLDIALYWQDKKIWTFSTLSGDVLRDDYYSLTIPVGVHADKADVKVYIKDSFPSEHFLFVNVEDKTFQFVNLTPLSWNMQTSPLPITSSEAATVSPVTPSLPPVTPPSSQPFSGGYWSINNSQLSGSLTLEQALALYISQSNSSNIRGAIWYFNDSTKAPVDYTDKAKGLINQVVTTTPLTTPQVTTRTPTTQAQTKSGFDVVPVLIAAGFGIGGLVLLTKLSKKR